MGFSGTAFFLFFWYVFVFLDHQWGIIYPHFMEPNMYVVLLGSSDIQNMKQWFIVYYHTLITATQT